MKALGLTEDHKKLILIMCESLFPKDYFSFDNDLGEDGFLDRNFIDTKENVKELTWNDEGSHFHWFDFCFNQLLKRIDSYYSYSRYCSEEGHIHLVDYLFIKFNENKELCS